MVFYGRPFSTFRPLIIDCFWSCVESNNQLKKSDSRTSHSHLRGLVAPSWRSALQTSGAPDRGGNPCYAVLSLTYVCHYIQLKYMFIIVNMSVSFLWFYATFNTVLLPDFYYWLKYFFWKTLVRLFYCLCISAVGLVKVCWQLKNFDIKIIFEFGFALKNTHLHFKYVARHNAKPDLL